MLQDLRGGNRLLQPVLPNDLSGGAVLCQTTGGLAIHHPHRRYWPMPCVGVCMYVCSLSACVPVRGRKQSLCRTSLFLWLCYNSPQSSWHLIATCRRFKAAAESLEVCPVHLPQPFKIKLVNVKLDGRSSRMMEFSLFPFICRLQDKSLWRSAAATRARVTGGSRLAGRYYICGIYAWL